MDLEVVGTLHFFFVTRFYVLGKYQCERHEYFWIFPPNHAAQIFNWSYQRSSDFDAFWEIFFKGKCL